MTPNELPAPRSRVEDYLAVLVERAGATIPEGVPRSRVEAYLRYICEEGVSGLTNGYYYEGAFYKDAEHTELIEPKEGRAYLDVANLAIYIYQNGEYKDYLANVTESLIQLDERIDNIEMGSDVSDVVSVYDRGTDTSKTDIVHYDTSKLTPNNIVKILEDETKQDAITYYRWSGSAWSYLGKQGPFYTKAETDTKLAEKQNLLSTGEGISLVDDELGIDFNIVATCIYVMNHHDDTKAEASVVEITDSDVDEIVES